MKDGLTYPRNTALAVLLMGHPGAGKTTLAMTFPRPYFIDADQNLRSAIERYPQAKFTYDCPEFDDAGKSLPAEKHWPRLEQLIKENAAKPEVGSIVIDGLGRVTDYLKAYLIDAGSQAEKALTVGGMRVMTMTLWTPFSDLLKRLVFLCRSYGKPFIMTAHLKVDENEMTAVKEMRVHLQGQLVADFQKLYTDAWMCDATPNSDPRYAKANGVRYYVRTAPTHRMMLKQSCGLPAEFEPGDAAWTALMAKLSGGAGSAPAT